MSKVSKILRDIGDERTGSRAYAFWCLGCKRMHSIPLQRAVGDTRDIWSFDGNLEAPTFSPSLLIRQQWGQPLQTRVCHSFIRAGRIEYLSDCTHALAGHTVDLPEFPHAEWDG